MNRRLLSAGVVKLRGLYFDDWSRRRMSAWSRRPSTPVYSLYIGADICYLPRMSAANASREYDSSCTIWSIIPSIRQGLNWHRIRQSLFQSIFLASQVSKRITAESGAWRSKHWPWACSASLWSPPSVKGTCQVPGHDFSQNATWLRQIKISQDETTW